MNHIKTHRICTLTAMTAASILISSAEGFRNPTSGASNLGRTGGRIAHVDNASAITQNPANLADLKTAEAYVSLDPIFISVEHVNRSGATAKTENAWKLLPSAYASMPLKDGQYVMGLGITSPFGLSNEWQNSGGFADDTNPAALRYATPHFSELQTVLVNPTLAFKLREDISMGLGLDVIWSQLTFKQHVFPDGLFVAEGDGTGLGANIGFTWEFAEGKRLALAVRSPVSVEYDGSFDMSIPAAGSDLHTSFSSEIDFPTQIHFGYGFDLTDRIRLEADLEYLAFSSFDTLPTQTGVAIPGLPTSSPQDWHDTYTLGFGGDMSLTENWLLRAGYQFFESPVPNATFSPTIPDSNQHALTIGVGYKAEKYSIDAAYGMVLYADRDIQQGGPFDGTFDMTVHLFALTCSRRF
ncbi:MAG: outer membrane protein transport protein [Verrucomicrobiota bacterium]|jgi:long-chain fatty acid transport protein|nr:outer membrane protein transport protein [Verrucomicrobiota bacterium]